MAIREAGGIPLLIALLAGGADSEADYIIVGGAMAFTFVKARGGV